MQIRSLFKLFITLTAMPCLNAYADHIDVYFGTGGAPAEGIYRGVFDTDSGELSEIELAAKLDLPGFLAIDPNSAHIYAVALQGDDGIVAAYDIAEDGALNLLNTALVPDGKAVHVAVHPSGKFLLTAQYSGGSVSVFPLGADGSVGACVQNIAHEGGSGVDAKRQTKPHPHWTGFSPDGRFAFIPDLGLDQIVIYKVDADAPSITRIGEADSIPGGGPRHMRFSVDGKFIYLLNELTLSVTTFAYDAQTGLAERRTTTPALSEEAKAAESFVSASEILVHPNGRFIYSANRGHDTITAYHANTDTGELTVTEVENIRGSWPRNINLMPGGKWLLAAGAHSNSVASFAIDQETGALQFQRGKISQAPNVICILPVAGNSADW